MATDLNRDELTMPFAGTPTSAVHPLDRQLRVSSLYGRCSASWPSDRRSSTPSPPVLRNIVKRFSASSLFDRPGLERNSFCSIDQLPKPSPSPNQLSSPPPNRSSPSPSPPPTPPPVEQHPAFRKRDRPKHVPIVITKDIIASVLKGLPESPELQDVDLSSDYLTPLEELRHRTKVSQGQQLPRKHPESSPQRPRHIPIVIPDFAHPFGRLPPSPSSSGESTPRQTFTPVLSSSLSPLPAMSSRTTAPAAGIGASRPSTADSAASTSSHSGWQDGQASLSSSYHEQSSSSQSSLNQTGTPESASQSEQPPMPRPSTESAIPAPVSATAPGLSPNIGTSSQQPSSGTGAGTGAASTNLAGLVCNVHRCTGKEPHGLVGATTTVLGDKLYVFGGKRLSRRRSNLTSDLYELDLIQRHWIKLDTHGSIPPPRYFHSMCALGDNKLICYGGMSPVSKQHTQAQAQDEQPAEVVVMSDIHIYDTTTRTWTYVPTKDNPEGRYAHCATVLPSSAVFTSTNAPLSAIHNNPSSGNPNQGTIGVGLDGTGGAEMIVVGGQDSKNHYIEQTSVFNLRSLKWTSTISLGKSCGAYRSVVAPLSGISPSRVGQSADTKEAREEVRRSRNSMPDTSSMLIYSNYNFLDVRLELQIRLPDGSIVEKQMNGPLTPPGLRFPNGGVLDKHFVVSGTYLTSSRQEYALWILDLRTLSWSRIDAVGSVFTQGSWNRGVLWPRRNTFVILGNRKRDLVDDYNHRRINFSNICLVELEAFGLYENIRHSTPTSAFISGSAPNLPPALRPKMSAWTGGGRPHFAAAEELGRSIMDLRELSDMDILSITGERIPANSHLLARRWGPFYVHLLREGSTTERGSTSGDGSGGDASTLKPPAASIISRNSSITITPTVNTVLTSASHASHSGGGPDSSASSTLVPSNRSESSSTTATTNTSASANIEAAAQALQPPNTTNLLASTRSRTLYLPHTPLTIQALLHFLYTSSLPPATHPLSSPQILCSLLQLARPYCVDGLLEATVERLHQVMDGRNAAAVFNASAMAAGGGAATSQFKTQLALVESDLLAAELMERPRTSSSSAAAGGGAMDAAAAAAAAATASSGHALHPASSSRPRLNGIRRSDVARTGSPSEGSDDGIASASSTGGAGGGNNTSGTSDAEDAPRSGGRQHQQHHHRMLSAEDEDDDDEVWSADRSHVVGLQKRGLRGLMEGRRMRERGRSVGAPASGSQHQQHQQQQIAVGDGK